MGHLMCQRESEGTSKRESEGTSKREAAASVDGAFHFLESVLSNKVLQLFLLFLLLVFFVN